MKSLEFEKVSVDDARKALEGPAKAADKPATDVRRDPEAKNPVLLDATVAGWRNCGAASQLAQRFPPRTASPSLPHR
jgi:hypothetical protein